MKNIFVLLTIVVLSVCTGCGQVSVDLLNVEIPGQIKDRTERYITHKGYVVSYNYDWKIPNWVAYELTAEEACGDVPRKNNFAPDPMVPKYVTAMIVDYKNSGWDRGHMAPAGDMKWDEQAMRESFYFSNICPQNPELNGGDWKDLEEQVRDLAIKKRHIYVVCGPIVSDDPMTIGINSVVVPEAFFKVLLQEDEGEIFTIGFVYENVGGHKPMSSRAMTVDDVETITDIDFFPSLPDDVECVVESKVDFERWVVSYTR